jgi:predicted ATP-grasp superfamily ATP-dependent carboligase
LPDAETFKIAADKGLLAEFMINNNIPTPDTIFNLTEDLEENLNKFRFPVLLKPKEGLAGKNLSGGPGITLFEEKQKLFKFISERNIKSQYIIQSFTEGYVLGCNVLYKDGHLLTYSIQKGLIPASNKFAPSLGIEFYENEEVISVADQLMSKLRWNGLANIDLIYDIKEQKIKVLEINPRVWTTIIGSMVTAKINFPVLACKLALDMPVEYTPSKVGKYIAVREFLTYNYVNRFNKKVNFNFKDIHIKYTVVTLLPKLLAVVTLLPKLLEMSNRRKKT